MVPPMSDLLDFRPVTAANWDSFERFFSGPGAPKHCWCMVWRRTAQEAKLQAPAERRRMMIERIDAGTPVGHMACVHTAAATANFLALECHALDVPWWDKLVEGVEEPIVNKGFTAVPDKPGLGVTLNEDVFRQHLKPGTGFFEPTTEWNEERSWDRTWS